MPSIMSRTPQSRATVPAQGAQSGTPSPATMLSVEDLVLLRIAAGPGGATRADLQRDLAALFGPRAAGTQFRREAEQAIANLTDAKLTDENKGRLNVTARGQASANARLSPTRVAAAGWPSLRAALIARSIGLPGDTGSIAKALERVETLAGLVLQQHFGLSVAKPLSLTDLRTSLAVVALERAFGNKIKTGLGRGGAKGSGLPGKTARLLAGQLFKSPREFSTDGKLVVALACDIATAREETLDALSLALLRRLTAASLEVPDRAPPPVPVQPKPAPRADNDAQPIAVIAAQTLQPARQPTRPDMSEFAGAVIAAARPLAEGWPGSRKAFISLVWRAIRDTRPDWELSEVAFKSMLAEAHRAGHVVLAGADLKERCDLKALEDSKILYKNTVWNFVRVED